MKTLGAKLKNKKGFTLMEMLIVVAIMVILVAVSIPVFTSQLNNAKKATDDANVRAAKSVMLTAYMTGTVSDTDNDGKIVMYYDAESGTLVGSASGVTKYGQGSVNIAAVGGAAATTNKDKVIKLTLTTSDSKIQIDWE